MFFEDGENKVIKVEGNIMYVEGEPVAPAGQEYTRYMRMGPGNWYEEMGSSWEETSSLAEDAALEKEFQENKRKRRAWRWI
ncbi:hypothetical protein [Neomegalonema sp.]|uniref:hypothetical protein n=1 Tax=Neomegalonema sp. TaxID=2039713 RepID=UPI00262EFE6E|nr:hypothetical protein [Neomegalonema sp.]MDD2869657.1 hypothetical protein [Neomegalonema sp.]